ncbi:hypothetical protein BGZ65_008484, partial [Modicella reniformis]
INEFYTSKRCPSCKQFVAQVTLRRLYCPKCKAYHHRDVLAAHNMYNVVRGYRRPTTAPISSELKMLGCLRPQQQSKFQCGPPELHAGVVLALKGDVFWDCFLKFCSSNFLHNAWSHGSSRLGCSAFYCPGQSKTLRRNNQTTNGNVIECLTEADLTIAKSDNIVVTKDSDMLVYQNNRDQPVDHLE